MSGTVCAIAGILSGMAGGGGPTREPPTGDYYDANNRVTYTTAIGGSPPFSSYTQAVFRWGGVNVADTGQVYYPDVADTTAVAGGKTYSAGSYRSGGGGDPNITTYGIYREG